ncbi:MAG TPA: pirin family protein [Flavobacteriaceae bacterium]|nr:pirin family protein [Flavobacteriaceae bacterium]HEX5743712.1 pirin family protein [Flavobacteriaceae bacterium]
MKTILYRSIDRGYMNHGWLNAAHYFSFANYFNPEKIQFGALRVLNDDIIKGGSGFGEHSHDNMEIITIPLKGALHHKDSMHNKWIKLSVDEVQVMSAGTGLIHAEKNANLEEDLMLFQIWIFPNQQEVTPRYDQKKFLKEDRNNKLQTLVTSFDDENKETLKIYQNAKISRIELSENQVFNYDLMNDKNGVFVLLVDGIIQINQEILKRRDAIGISETDKITIQIIEKSDILLIEVPMLVY